MTYLNQPPPIAPYNVVRGRPRAGRGARARGRRLGRRPPARHRRAGRQPRGDRARRARRAQRADPAHARPLRQSHRPGRARPVLALDACARRSSARSTRCRGAIRSPAPTSCARRCSSSGARSAPGVMCPVSMTYAAIPPLRENAELAAEWEPRLTRAELRRRRAGRHGDDREAGRLGRARQHHPRRAAVGDGTYEITGHKWFCSYPPCDVFLTLAQAPAGLSCFLFEGRDPGFRIQRLKDKLGTRSLPSSEVEFHGVRGRLIGEEGRGVATIIRMVNHTRLDCLLGSTAGDALGCRPGRPPRPPPQRLRQAAGRAARDAERARRPGGRVRGGDRHRDADRPRLRRGRRAVPPLRHGRHEVLGLQARAAARGRGARVPGRQRLRRGVGHAAAAPRLAAQLDLGGLGQRGGARRAARDRSRSPRACRPSWPSASWRAAATRCSTPTSTQLREAPGPRTRSATARRIVEDLALALQASLLVRNAPPAVADAFCAGRLGEGGRAFGTLPATVDAGAIVERALAV